MTNDTHDRQVAVSELAGSLSTVLDEVAAGASITVTRNGVPVAVLAPTSDSLVFEQGSPVHAEEALAEYRSGTKAAQDRPPATALARLIGTPSTRAVMAVFLLDPALVLHQREIARRAGVGLRSAQIALARLEAVGLLASERDGNRLNYRALRTERFEALRALMTRELGVVEVIARHLHKMDEAVAWAFVFGSAASGEDTLGSDIDLLVVTDATDDALVEPIAEAQRELGREIDLVSYRPEEFARRQAEGNHFIESVLGQPRIDVVGGPDGS